MSGLVILLAMEGAFLLFIACFIALADLLDRLRKRAATSSTRPAGRRLRDPLERIWRLDSAQDPPLVIDRGSYRASVQELQDLPTIEPRGGVR